MLYIKVLPFIRVEKEVTVGLPRSYVQSIHAAAYFREHMEARFLHVGKPRYGYFGYNRNINVLSFGIFHISFSN